MENNAVVLEKVSFSFNKAQLLEDVNLKIEKGGFTGVIGPNGGGKTTLLKLIIGLLKPKEGRVTVLGKKPEEIRSKIGYVPQSSQLDKYFPITLLELVLLGCLSKGSFMGIYPQYLKEKAKYLLEKMELYHLKDRPFGQLSGGETQRALIARALICDPEILVLDEATSNIDVKAERKILDLILQNKEDKTIIMVSHDLEVIIEYVKNIVFVKHNVTTTLPQQVCEHFALGLYHKPFLKK
jgi:zinc transport system ATP-binding protein